jgi:REP-associated tyrosine transposase
MKRLGLDPIGWHVFARGARRLDLYRDEQDYDQFLIFLRFAIKKSGCILWAFVLMSNHYHLVLYGSSAQLTACMRRLNGMYSRYHNRRYGLSGHTFDGPYHAYPQPSPLLLLRAVAYVFMNPVAAGIATVPEQYRWSCFKSYTAEEGSPIDVDPSGLMAHANPDPKTAWAQFHRALEREARRRPRIRPGSLTRVQIHADQFECLLEHARERREGLAGEDPDLVAMHWAHELGICPKAMAQVLESETPAHISQRLHYFRQRLAQNPSLAKLLQSPE